MEIFTKTFLLFLVLLNPFTLSIYLLGVIKALNFIQFSKQIFWASFISLLAFVSFALAGDALFERVFQVRFASFQVFGGITFLIIGIRLILGTGPPMEALRTDSSQSQLSGAIAMPFIVGPGTISASVLAGSRLDPPLGSHFSWPFWRSFSLNLFMIMPSVATTPTCSVTSALPGE